MKIMARGAEAVIYSTKEDGRDVIVKERVKKSYRLPEIDEELRKERTRKESRLLKESLRAGIGVPEVIGADIEGAMIKMEAIGGRRLREAVESMDKEGCRRVFVELGKAVAKLHEKGIAHGDLTTSNVILKGGIPYLIDFGLGSFTSRVEDFAMDLALLSDVLRSSHPRLEVWEAFVDGYSSFLKSAQVLQRLGEIEKRGRYVSRE